MNYYRTQEIIFDDLTKGLWAEVLTDIGWVKIDCSGQECGDDDCIVYADKTFVKQAVEAHEKRLLRNLMPDSQNTQ